MNKRIIKIVDCKKCEHKFTLKMVEGYHCNKFYEKQGLECDSFKLSKRKRK